MEKEIKEGIFISVVTKKQWVNRIDTLEGDDRKHFIEKCNPFNEADQRSLKKTLGFNLVDLYYLCKDIEPDFDVQEDFYTVRYAPDIK
jgi:hypothetical protein